MRSHSPDHTLALLLAYLLAALLFLVTIATPGAHLWGRYLIPIVVVYLWGRRRDIYIVTALASVLIAADFWFEGAQNLEDLLSNQVLPLAVLWTIAWLLSGRQQAQALLAAQAAKVQASERKYHDLFDNSPDMYLTATAADHVISEYNLTLARTLGYTREELIGQPASMLLTPTTYGVGEAAWAGYVASGSVANLEVQLCCKDGTTLDVLASGHYDPGAAGRPTYSRITFRDISGRKRSEERLREALQQLQLATDAAEIGIWNWNFADRRRDWDDRTCDLYALPPDRRRAGLYYDVWQARVHPDDLAQAAPADGDPQLKPARWSGTYRIVLPGGALRHVQCAAVKDCDRDGRRG